MIRLDAPAIGFRAFKWNGGALCSIGVAAEWPVQREPQCAECLATRESHSAPQENCSCGIYAHSKPELVHGGIKAVTIGYGRLIVHPDGWRAEKSEIIGLIAPEKSPERPQLINQQYLEEHIMATTFFSSHVIGTAPSPEALEILAEQYGARVIQNWDDGIALAQEQGAAPIPDEIYKQADRGDVGGTFVPFVPPIWVTNEYIPLIKTITPTKFALTELGWSEVTTIKEGKTQLIPQEKKTPIDESMQLKREKRELHAKLWGPDAKAA